MCILFCHLSFMRLGNGCVFSWGVSMRVCILLLTSVSKEWLRKVTHVWVCVRVYVLRRNMRVSIPVNASNLVAITKCKCTRLIEKSGRKVNMKTIVIVNLLDRRAACWQRGSVHGQREHLQRPTRLVCGLGVLREPAPLALTPSRRPLQGNAGNVSLNTTNKYSNVRYD